MRWTGGPRAGHDRQIVRGSALDFCDQDIPDPGALDRSKREPLGRVLNSLREMLLVDLHRTPASGYRCSQPRESSK